MKRATLILTIFLLPALFTGLACASDPDRYMGDSAIYSGHDSSADLPRPNVLLIIDNSRATLNAAPGEPYDPATIYPWKDDAGDLTGYYPWHIYKGDQLGNFTFVEIANPTPDDAGYNAADPLPNLLCPGNNDFILNTLLNGGTYSGAGSVAFPNFFHGDCYEAPMGQVYATGNYLNYAAPFSGADGDIIVENTYTKANGRETTDKFLLTQSHSASADKEPGVGADWGQYWTTLSPSDRRAAVPWDPNAVYAVSAASTGTTQQEIIYGAVGNLLRTAGGTVNFGAVAYNPMVQGAVLTDHMTDLRKSNWESLGPTEDPLDATKVSTFLANIPGGTNEPGIIDAGPQRPQAEALYDAGFYFKAVYEQADGARLAPTVNLGFTEQVPDAIVNPCDYNHIILLTNGLPNQDGGSFQNLSGIGDRGDYDGDGIDETFYGAGTHYLDDVAAYLHTNYDITVHTILAFQSTDALIANTAADGGGQFHNVFSAEELSQALTKLIAGIVNETSTSFVAPVVPASTTNRTISSNRVYLGLFKPQSGEPWLGNLKKYKVSSSLTLLDKDGNAATDSNGDFIEDSKSYWGTESSGAIMSFDGALPVKVGGTEGDGGNVGAGGAGGSLKARVIAALSGTPDYEPRDIYTYLPGVSSSTTLTHADNAFSTTNSDVTATLLGVADDDEKDSLIHFVQGFDDADMNGTLEARKWVLGDILHSKPLVFNYSNYADADENDCSANTSRIYVGANDGMLHAFRDCDGSEEWAFVPDNVLGNLKNQRNELTHSYYIDGPPTSYVHDTDNDGIIETGDGDRVILIFGQRRGGGIDTLADDNFSRGAYYALDVSVPAAPKFLWKIDNQTLVSGDKKFIELGETWGQPRLAKMRIGTAKKVVALFGAGYDNNEDLRYGATASFPDGTDGSTSISTVSADAGDVASSGSDADGHAPKGRGIFAVEVATLKTDPFDTSDTSLRPDFTNSGSYIWRHTFAEDSAMSSSIPSALTVLDWDNDSYADRIYAGDTGGNMWRFQVRSAVPSAWTANKIFSSNDSTSKGRKIFFKPAVAKVHGAPVLYFGTGDRAHPLNRSVEDRLYAVKDKGQVTSDAIDEADLVDVTLDKLQEASSTSNHADTVAAIKASLDSSHGWFIKLEKTGTFAHPGEKVLAPALVFNGEAFFTTYSPNTSGSTDPCEVGNLGVSRLYHLDYRNGSAVANYDTSNDISDADNKLTDGGKLGRGDRFNSIGSGIPSGIVVLIDASGKVSLMISSSNKVGTYQAPDAKIISPVYWKQW